MSERKNLQYLDDYQSCYSHLKSEVGEDTADFVMDNFSMNQCIKFLALNKDEILLKVKRKKIRLAKD